MYRLRPALAAALLAVVLPAAGVAGWVLDLSTRSWIEIADRGERPQGEAVVAAGQALFAFGGARWHDGYSRAELLANAALGTPPEVEP